MPPRSLRRCLYVTSPTPRATWLSQTRSRKAAASGPVTSILANEVSSNRPALVRVARCSTTADGDQSRPAPPRGAGPPGARRRPAPARPAPWPQPPGVVAAPVVAEHVPPRAALVGVVLDALPARLPPE